MFYMCNLSAKGYSLKILLIYLHKQDIIYEVSMYGLVNNLGYAFCRKHKVSSKFEQNVQNEQKRSQFKPNRLRLPKIN